MLERPKQIIVDKEALVRININELCGFTRNHFLLGCGTLLYECSTTSEAKRPDMLSRYKKLIKAGAYYCSCSITFIRNECENCVPYPWFLPDLEATEQIRKDKASVGDILDSPKTVGAAFQSRCKIAKSMFIDLSDKVKKRIDLENPDVGNKIKDLTSDKLERFRILFESIDKNDLHQMCVESFP